MLPEAGAPRGSARILVVDDDAVNLRAAASILRLVGYGVTAVSDGRTALAEVASSRDLSVIVLDVMMPEVSGYEVCRKIREDRRNFELPVLMLTASPSTESMALCFEAGANDYLSKPYEPEELLARVGTLEKLKASVDRAMAAETAFMQAQIRPHFLFNTLNAISSFCDTDPARAQRLIDDFADYLRQSFDCMGAEGWGTLESELEFVHSYVKIQKERFGEALQILLPADEMEGLRLPVLSIQPLVENAIVHGLRKCVGGGTVRVSVQKIPEGVRVAVEDDGQGIPPETLQTLLTIGQGHGLGLKNIDRRLKKFYGRGLLIESVPGRGTTVSYVIPLGGESA
jgi:sensor histidine kinase YesM